MARYFDPDAKSNANGSEQRSSRGRTGETGGPSSFGDFSRYALVPPPMSSWPLPRPHTAPETSAAAAELSHSRRVDAFPLHQDALPPPFGSIMPNQLDNRPVTSNMPPPIRHDTWPSTPADRSGRYDPPLSTQPLVSPIGPFTTRPVTSSSANTESGRGRFRPTVPIATRPPAIPSSASSPAGAIPGFQPDYSRVRHLRAPSAPALGGHGGGVPLESIMMVRVGDAPVAGARDIRGPIERWSVSTHLLSWPPSEEISADRAGRGVWKYCKRLLSAALSNSRI